MLNPGINAMSKILALHVSGAWSCSTVACSCCPRFGVLEVFWHQYQYARAPWALQAMSCCVLPVWALDISVNRDKPSQPHLSWCFINWVRLHRVELCVPGRTARSGITELRAPATAPQHRPPSPVAFGLYPMPIMISCAAKIGWLRYYSRVRSERECVWRRARTIRKRWDGTFNKTPSGRSTCRKWTSSHL